MSNEWISVETEMPEEKLMVLIVAIKIGPNKDYTTDMYCSWFDGCRFPRWPHDADVTHWMPLPSPPDTGE